MHHILIRICDHLIHLFSTRPYHLVNWRIFASCFISTNSIRAIASRGGRGGRGGGGGGGGAGGAGPPPPPPGPVEPDKSSLWSDLFSSDSVILIIVTCNHMTFSYPRSIFRDISHDKCWKWCFGASKFENFLGEDPPPRLCLHDSR